MLDSRFDLKPGTYLSDQRNQMVAAQNLQNFATEYKHNGKPFFVGLGFHKPHLPYAIFPSPLNTYPGCP